MARWSARARRPSRLADATRIVHLQKTVGSRLDAQGLQAEPVQPGRLPDGDDELLGRELSPVGQRESRSVGSQLRPDGPGARANVDSLPAKDLRQNLGHGGLLGQDQARRPLDDRDARAEASQDLRDLATHRPAAEHERRLGQLRRRIEILARPRRCPIQALDLGNHRDRAGGDDEIGPADGPPVDLEGAGSNDASARAVHGDAECLRLARALGVVETVGDFVAPGRRGAIRELAVVETQRPAHRALRVGVGDPMADLRRMKHRFAGHAGEVRALAAEQPLLHDRHRLAAVRDRRRDRLGRGAATQHHDVVRFHELILRRVPTPSRTTILDRPWSMQYHPLMFHGPAILGGVGLDALP